MLSDPTSSRKTTMRCPLLTVPFAILCLSGPALAADAALWTDFVEATSEGREPIVPDFSFAGYRYSEQPIPDVQGATFDVTDYGAVPDDDGYDDGPIQAAIDAATEAGGGIVFFPPGRFIVSPDDNVDDVIRIDSSHIVLRGSGDGTGGTEIFMDARKVSSFMFQFEPESTSDDSLAVVTADAARESYWVTVDDASELEVGQRVVIQYKDPAYAAIYFEPLPVPDEWTRLWETGFRVHEIHKVAEIEGTRVRFYEPLHIELKMHPQADFTLVSYPSIEEIGIEDIRFSGNWDSYPEEFEHHKDDIHDYAWNGLRMEHVQNAWVRRCTFANWNQGLYFDSCAAITVEQVEFTGKKGHMSIHARRGYGVLVRDCEDVAAHHHGPGVGYQGVATVYLRHKMQVDQRIDSHSGTPYATLFDQVRGGQLGGNGGPVESLPHHGRDFVFWNFVHRATEDHVYDFWNMDKRENNTFALPIFAGFTADHEVVFVDEATKVLVNESFGASVLPGSLFEAQLTLRLGTSDLPGQDAGVTSDAGTPPPPSDASVTPNPADAGEPDNEHPVSGPAATFSPSGDPTGCSCNVAQPVRSGPAWLILAVVAGVGRSRRRLLRRSATRTT